MHYKPDGCGLDTPFPLPPHIGAPLIIHPGRNESAPFEILDVLAAAGADLSRTVMSHLDRTILDDQKLLELAKRGCYLEYDLFGIECSHYQVGGEKCNLTLTLTLIVVRPDWSLFFLFTHVESLRMRPSRSGLLNSRPSLIPRLMHCPWEQGYS